MKAKLIFNLPEDSYEYLTTTNASKYLHTLHSFTDKLRSYRKYGHDFKDADDALERITQDLYAIIEENSVDINEN